MHGRDNSKHYQKEMELEFFITKIINIKSSISNPNYDEGFQYLYKSKDRYFSMEGCGIFSNWPVCVSSDRECLLSGHGELHYRNGDPINSMLLAISSATTNSMSQVSKKTFINISVGRTIDR